MDWGDVRAMQARGCSTAEILAALDEAGTSVEALGPPPDVAQSPPRRWQHEDADGRVCPACGCRLEPGTAPTLRFCRRGACVRHRAREAKRRSRLRLVR